MVSVGVTVCVCVCVCSFQDVCTGLMVAHRVSRLVSDSPYVFRLAVMNKAGRSDWSEEVVYQTTRQPPPVVTGLYSGGTRL